MLRATPPLSDQALASERAEKVVDSVTLDHGGRHPSAW